MRYARFLFGILAFATMLLAADPFAGTWTMNPAKTKFKTGSAFKEQTVTIAESGGNLDVEVKGTASDGASTSTHYTVPADGGNGKIVEAPYEAVSGKRMSPRERETVYSKGGKTVFTAHSTLSKDGKTMTVHTKGTDPRGQMIDAAVVLDKQ